AVCARHAPPAPPPARAPPAPPAARPAPPARRPPPAPPPLPTVGEPLPVATAVALDAEAVTAVPLEAPPVAEPADPLAEAARSAPARRGLHTKRQLYHRIVRTRKLIDLWNQPGKHLAPPQPRLTRPPEATALLPRFRPL